MSGNGVDLGSIYQLLATVAAEVRAMRLELDRKADKADVDVLKRDVGRLTDDVGRLRQDVAGYHSSVVGHGLLISELDDRVRRVEQHLDLC